MAKLRTLQDRAVLRGDAAGQAPDSEREMVRGVLQSPDLGTSQPSAAHLRKENRTGFLLLRKG